MWYHRCRAPQTQHTCNAIGCAHIADSHVAGTKCTTGPDADGPDIRTRGRSLHQGARIRCRDQTALDDAERVFFPEEMGKDERDWTLKELREKRMMPTYCLPYAWYATLQNSVSAGCGEKQVIAISIMWPCIGHSFTGEY